MAFKTTEQEAKEYFMNNEDREEQETLENEKAFLKQQHNKRFRS